MTAANGSDDRLLEAALSAASDTKCLRMGYGVLRETAEVFTSLFGSTPAVLIADENTFTAAGRVVADAFRAAGQQTTPELILPGNIHAEYPLVDEVREALLGTNAIPVAVGSGTISDLTKLAAHQVGRPYIVAATAASMDGYTAFGASITRNGSKQTFECPAARAVVADLDVVGAAPDGMNASGYADLVAKVPAGADWLAADACGEEAINPAVWETVQSRLRHWVGNPEGVASRDPETVRGLITGLLMTGFAMQAARSSRPASGAEHQFSHLWDMEHHTFRGGVPSHGFKVGIGSLASTALYDALLKLPLADLDVEQAVAVWPDEPEIKQEIEELFEIEELAAKAREESMAKHPTPSRLRSQLERLKGVWPELAKRLHRQLFPYAELRDMLRAAGAPADSVDIGISHDRLLLSCRKAYMIRRRFTVLDLARRTGRFRDAIAGLAARLEGAR